MNVYIKSVRVIDPVSGLDQSLNIWLKDGTIIHLGSDEANIDPETRTIDGNGLVCTPGLFDMHVHFRDPGHLYKEDLISGSAAAANGGFTGVVCMPNTEPAIDSILTAEYIKQKSIGLPIDVYFAGSITQNREGKLLSPMLELSQAGALFFTDDGSCVSNSMVMRRAFDYAATKDLLISQHCEDHSLTKNFSMNESEISYRLGLVGYPSVAESVIVARDIMLARYCGNIRYHVSHISTKEAIDLVRQAKQSGSRISCEAAQHHIAITDDALVSFDTNLKMNPPLRTKKDSDAIIEGLKDGTIDCLASDHAPHALNEKEVEFEKAPSGVIGLETGLAVALTKLIHAGHLTLTELIEKMSVNPRKILGLHNISIATGKIANLTIFDPEEEWVVNKQTFKSKSKNTPFHGMRLKGKPKFIVNNDQFIESKL